MLGALHLAHLDSGIVPREMNLWINYATKLVGEAVDLFSRFEVVTTDRLHAHILSCLMSIPNTVLNNSYGKNYSYVDAWTGSSNLVNLSGEQLPNETEKHCLTGTAQNSPRNSVPELSPRELRDKPQFNNCIDA